MNVVIAALSAPADMNGVSRHAANLVRSLLHRPEVSQLNVLVGAWQQQALAEGIAQEHARLRIHPVHIGSGTFNRNRWYYRDFPKTADGLDASIVHLTYPVPLSGTALHRPVIVSLHDMYPFDIPENFGFAKGLANRLVVRQCLHLADAIACVSESTRTRLEHWLGQKVAAKATMIPNPVEPVPYAQPPRGRINRAPFMLCVAQHRRNKNIPLTLRIFEQVVRSGTMSTQSRLVIVGGKGPETERIEMQIRNSRLQDRILLFRGVSDAELQWCYRNCAVLLAPSTTEGFGLPVVEALLAGCRVVCSDIPAFREVCGNLCRYVSLGDGELNRFAEAVRQALRAPRPAPVAMPRLAPEEIGKEYIILYHRLLSSRALRERTCPQTKYLPRSRNA